jgi:hypothetical protein
MPMAATVQISLVPKRMLTKVESAYHCGRSLRRFQVECPVRPVRFANGDIRYDVHELDRWLDTYKSWATGSEDIVSRLE